MKMTFNFSWCDEMRRFWLGMAMLAACGTAGGDGAVDSGTTQFVPPSDLPDTYAFASRFSDEDSVAYSGQAMRQVLIADLSLHMASLDGRVESGWMPTSGDVEVGDVDSAPSWDAGASRLVVVKELPIDLNSVLSVRTEVP